MRAYLLGLLMFLGAVSLAAAASLQDEMRDLERRSFQAIQRSDGSKGFQIRSSLRRVSAAASDLRTGPAGDAVRRDAYVQARNDHLALLGVPVSSEAAAITPVPDPEPASLAPRDPYPEPGPEPARPPDRRKKSLFSRLRSSIFGGEEEKDRGRKRRRPEAPFVLDLTPPQHEDFMRANTSGLNPYLTLQQYWAGQTGRE